MKSTVKEQTIHLTDYDSCYNVFTKNSTRASDLGLGSLFSRWLGSCLGCLDNEQWATTRKIFKPLFDVNYNCIDGIISQWNETLHQDYITAFDKNTPVSIQQLSKKLPLDCIVHIVFGKLREDESLKPLFSELAECAEMLMLDMFHNDDTRKIMYRFRFWTETNKRLNKFNKLWNRLMNCAISRQNDTLIFKDIYTNYIKNKHLVSYNMFSQTLIEIIYANQDVTTPSLEWLILHCAQYGNIFNDLEDSTDTDQMMNFINESARFAPMVYQHWHMD